MRKAISFIFCLYFLNPDVSSQVFGKIYEVDSLKEIIANHKIVAVIPFNYKITLKKMPKNTTQEDIKLQEEKRLLVCPEQLLYLCFKKSGEEGSNS